MNFLESPRFPDRIGEHSAGGPCFHTEIVTLPSGFEQRNACWSYPLRRFDVTSGIKSAADLTEILAFFNSVRGRWLGFRYKDWLDYRSSCENAVISSTDQLLGQGDGVQKAFQLIQALGTGVRWIEKPVLGSVCIAVDGVSADAVTVDHCTGRITFPDDQVPPEGAVITAGFEFDVPCRFDTDQLSISLQRPHLGSYTAQLIEVRCDKPRDVREAVDA
jgi:uncharacterized protein (TIGR02217 family)